MTEQNFSGRLEEKFNPFEKDYLEEILEAVAMAWKRMKKPARNEIEDRITFRLAGRLAKDLSIADIPYDISAQHWLFDFNGDLIGRLDLRFKHRASQSDYFSFEAKRLHVTYPGGNFSAEYSTYVGDAGMIAFVKGPYSKGLPAAGMLGYVMDGDSDKAWGGLEKRISSQRKPLKLTPKSNLVNSSLSGSIANAMSGTRLGETEHRLAKYNLRLFHILLPVSR